MLKCDTSLSHDELAGYLSPYLSSAGLGGERAVIDSLVCRDKQAIASCHVDDPYRSPYDGSFHLNGVVAIALVVHVGIIHGHLLNGRDRKTGDALLSELNVKLSRLIASPADITVSLRAQSRFITPPSGTHAHPRSFFRWSFDINQEWSGHVTLCLPFGDDRMSKHAVH